MLLCAAGTLLRVQAECCDPLPETAGRPASLLHTVPACFRFGLAAGNSTRISLDSLGDLQFRISGPDGSSVRDGFQFGLETLTLSTPGVYRIDIEPAVPKLENKSFRIWRNASPPAPLVALEQYETNSKRLRDPVTINESLRLEEIRGDDSGIARTCLKAGDAAYRKQQFPEALIQYRRALGLCEGIGDRRCIAEAANNIGLIERRRGNFEAARRALTQAEPLWKDLGLYIEQSTTLSNLGILQSRTGDYQAAVASYRRACSLVAGQEPLVWGRCLNNLGLTYLAMAEYDMASKYFSQAIAVEPRTSAALPDLLTARLNLGRTRMLTGRPVEARNLLESALERSSEVRDAGVRTALQNNLGQLLIRQGDFERGARLLTEALKGHHQQADLRLEAVAEFWLGEAARGAGNPAAARDWFEQSLRIRETTGLRGEAADVLEALAKLDWEQGDAARAIASAERGIALLESVRSRVPGAALRASFLARRRGLLDLLVEIAARPDNPNADADSFIASERSRARAIVDIVAERSAARPRSPEPVAGTDLFRRRREVRAELDMLSFQLSSGLVRDAEAHNRMQSLLALDGQIEAGILEEASRTEPAAEPPRSWDAFEKSYLDPDLALLEFHLGRKVSWLWLVSRSGVRKFELPDRSTIEAATAEFCRLFDQPRERARDSSKQRRYRRLRDWLSGALLGALPAGSLPKRVILVPDGALCGLPFAALTVSGEGFLGIHHDLISTPSANFLRYGQQTLASLHAPLSVLAIADPVFTRDDPRIPRAFRGDPPASGPDLARLPFVSEIEEIQRIAPNQNVRFVRGFDASVHEVTGLKRPVTILHLSSHAIIDDERPELSRIIFSSFDPGGRAVDAYLMPYRISRLRLNGSIVVVSACRTALGKQVYGEGLTGFTTSFFEAGAAQVVLTLSNVDAEGASVFLKEVYRRFLGHRSDMESSLRLARLAMFASPRWRDEAYWAGFVVMGTPTSGKSR